MTLKKALIHSFSLAVEWNKWKHFKLVCEAKYVRHFPRADSTT